MSGNNSRFDGSTDLEQLAQVGEARAERLREGGLDTVYEVADATVDELVDILTYAGETNAMKVKGSAQGHVRKLEKWQWVGDEIELVPTEDHDTDEDDEDGTDEDEEDDSWEDPDLDGEGSAVEPDVRTDVSDDAPAEEGQTRVVLLAGDGVWEDKSAGEVDPILNGAFRQWDIEPDVIGLPNDHNDTEVAHMADWLKRRRAHDDEWADVDLEWFDVEPHIRSEGFKEANPDDPMDDTKVIDYDKMSANGWWSEAFADRDELMMTWATHVIIVEDGDYASTPIHRVDELARPIVKTYIGQNESWKDRLEEEEDDDPRPTVVDEAADKETREFLDDDGWTDFNQYDGQAEEYKHEGGEPGDPTLL